MAQRGRHRRRSGAGQRDFHCRPQPERPARREPVHRQPHGYHYATGREPELRDQVANDLGLGPGSVTFIAAPSPNGPHGGSLYIANLTVTITQQAVNPNCVIRSPTISSVKSATDFGGFSTFASGSYLEVKGTNLAIGQRQWAAGDFQGPNAPQDLDGTSVSINGKLGFVSFISAQQINVQAPADSATGSAQITVTNCGGPWEASATSTNPKNSRDNTNQLCRCASF